MQVGTPPARSRRSRALYAQVLACPVALEASQRRDLQVMLTPRSRGLRMSGGGHGGPPRCGRCSPDVGWGSLLEVVASRRERDRRTVGGVVVPAEQDQCSFGRMISAEGRGEQAADLVLIDPVGAVC